MEIVNFAEQITFNEQAEQLFAEQSARLTALLPQADIQHVGSTAIPNSLTKGDLDIQIRVAASDFEHAVEVLSRRYELNDGSVSTDSFRAFKDDTTDPPLGVQLTVIDAEFDFFWKFRDVLRNNELYKQKYDTLKSAYNGKDMDDYRNAKNGFFEWLMETPEFKACKSYL